MVPRRTSLFLLLAACADKQVGVYNTAPTASIVSPPDGSTFPAGELVELYGLARDAQTDPANLAVRWESSIDGLLDEGAPDADGNLYFSTATLTEGDHAVTLTVTDELGEVASTSILLGIGDAVNHGGDEPVVTILGPTEGQVFTAAEAVNLIAAVTDAEDAEDTLTVELIDVPDGSVWTGSPTATGSLTVPLTLSAGTHALTVNATDSEGNVGSSVVNFSVDADTRPHATIASPPDGTEYSTLDTIVFRGTVSDADTDVEALGITWSSDLAGVFSSNSADSSGSTSVGAQLPAGVHTVTLTATDELGQTGLDSIVVTVIDPDDVDNDGDGVTENGGDCDDGDGGVYPDATDSCDAVDNNCDGFVNEPFFDTYELNNTRPGYACGEVDSGWLWAGATLTLSGLTLSDETDEDWFAWSADDEIYDNVSISVTASSFSGSGDFVVELYMNGGRTPVASNNGPSSVTVTYEGDWLDDGEDDWEVRIYAADWPRNSCNDTYTLTIHS